MRCREVASGCVTLVRAQKRGQEPIVRSILRAIWLLVPDPFSEPQLLIALLTEH